MANIEPETLPRFLLSSIAVFIFLIFTGKERPHCSRVWFAHGGAAVVRDPNSLHLWSTAMSLSRFVANLFSRDSVKNSRKRRSGRRSSRAFSRIGIEQLEDRRLLAITYMKVATVHTFTGDGADDTLTLSFNASFSQLT